MISRARRGRIRNTSKRCLSAEERLARLLSKLRTQGRIHGYVRLLFNSFVLLLIIDCCLHALIFLMPNIGARPTLEIMATTIGAVAFTIYVPAIITLVACDLDRWKEAETLWQQVNAVEAVGPLLEALDISKSAVRDPAERALLRLLPRLQTSDADCITVGQRACLHRILSSACLRRYQRHAFLDSVARDFFAAQCFDKPLVLATLKALEQIGDSSALPVVTQAAQSAADAEIRAAAADCLPYLQQRVGLQQKEQTLLRASDVPTPSPDTLLRPARETQANANALLRAAYDTDSESE